MSNQVLFWTQIVSLASFIVTLFALYRLLVKQKDATIELLRERNAYLNDQLQDARRSVPDVLMQNLQNRIRTLTEELERLNEDQESHRELIGRREVELAQAQQVANQLRKAQQALGEELFCPDCGAPLILRDVYMYDYHGYDADIEIREFECGRTLHDGREERPCPHRDNSSPEETSKPIL